MHLTNKNYATMDTINEGATPQYDWRHKVQGTPTYAKPTVENPLAAFKTTCVRLQGFHYPIPFLSVFEEFLFWLAIFFRVWSRFIFSVRSHVFKHLV